MSGEPSYSVVVPVFNSSASLHELADRLDLVFSNYSNETFEIIFVDDGSTVEQTWQSLTELAQTYDPIRAFRLSKNFGQGAATLAGIEKARGHWIITMDDDLQHYPEDIPSLLEHRQHDVVIARFSEKKCTYSKKLFSRLKSALDTRLLGLPKNLVSSSFKVISRRVALEILAINTPRPFMIALVLAVTSDIVNVEVMHGERRYGDSNYSVRRSLSLISNLLFNNSAVILRLMSIFGFSLAGLSFLFGVFLVIKHLIYQSMVEGWASLMVVMLSSTGVVVACLGLLGEYVSRLIETAERRPLYAIKEERDSVESE